MPQESNSKQPLVVVITGASSGIGKSTALAFAQMGECVIIAARRAEALIELELQCLDLGAADVLAVTTDVSNYQSVQNLANRAMERFGRLDVWVNNAAVTSFGHFEDIPEDDILQIVKVDLVGQMYGAKAVLPIYKAQGYGTLINVASMVAAIGQPYAVAYTASKFGVRGLSVGLSQELRQYPNIHICTVMPSVVDTPFFQQGGNYMGKQVKPPGPVISPYRVAETIVSLTVYPRKEVIVGNLPRLFVLLRFLNKNLFDKLAGESIYQLHFSAKPEPIKKGNLNQPDTKMAKLTGGWSDPNRQLLQKLILPVSFVGIGGLGILSYLYYNKWQRESRKQHYVRLAKKISLAVFVPTVLFRFGKIKFRLSTKKRRRTNLIQI